MTIESLADEIQLFHYDESVSESENEFQDNIIFKFLNLLEKSDEKSPESRLKVFFNLLTKVSKSKNNPFYFLCTEYDSYLMSVIVIYIKALGHDKFAKVLNTNLLSKLPDTEKVVHKLFHNLFFVDYYDTLQEAIYSIGKAVKFGDVHIKELFVDILSNYKAEISWDVETVIKIDRFLESLE